MKYNKPPLSFEEQADRLLSRGMIGDRDVMITRMQSVSYYRLSGYWYPFRLPDSNFKPNTTFDMVWERYVFDRQLRILVMDAIERIEVAVRTQLTYYHSHKHQAFGYATDPATLPGLNKEKLQEFLERIQKEQKRSQETFVKHFRNKYGDYHRFLPVWMVTEVMAFGSVLSFYRGASPEIQKKVARYLCVPDRVLTSWLLAINTVRNICAHHGRLWNRELGTRPLIPNRRKYPEWEFFKHEYTGRIFIILTICRHCLAIIAPQSKWPQRLINHFNLHPRVPLRSMGFPNDWRESFFWANLEELGYGG